MAISSVHVFEVGTSLIDLRSVVAVSDTSDPDTVRVFTLDGLQEGIVVNRAAFEAAYQASLDAA